jgi:hypothetical protein
MGIAHGDESEKRERAREMIIMSLTSVIAFALNKLSPTTPPLP